MATNRKMTMTKSKPEATVDQLEKLRDESKAKVAARPPEPAPDTCNKPVERLIAEHFVVDVNGNTRVVSFDDDGKVRIQRKADFEQFNANINDNKGKRMKRFWKEATRYRGLICDPSTDELVTRGKLNTWRGWNIKPAKGDWSLMRRHIEEVIANGHTSFYNYTINWTAWSLQNPGIPAEVALFIRGVEGCGKGIFGRVLCLCFGDVHSRHLINPSQITGRFNAQMQQCSFLFADEAVVPQDKRAEAVLKGLITEPTINVEKKGIDAFSVPNLLHIYGSTNEQWVAPMSAEARRFAVQTASPTHRGDRDYFVPLFNQMFKEGGAEAMLYDMLYVHALGDDWHPRYDIPATDEATKQKLASLHGIDRLIMEICDSGSLPEANEDAADIAITTGEALGQGFWAHCRKNVMGLKFTSAKAMATTLRKEWGCTSWHSGSQSGIRFPPLAVLREAFETKYGKVEWSAADNIKDWVIG